MIGRIQSEGEFLSNSVRYFQKKYEFSGLPLSFADRAGILNNIIDLNSHI